MSSPTARSRRINSCRKGKAVERQACAYLTSLGFPAHRAARNGVRGAQDIICESLRGAHIEVKGDEKIDLGTQALSDALSQAWTALFKIYGCTTDCRPAVLWKKNRTHWRLTTDEFGGQRCTYDTDSGIKTALNRLRGPHE